MMPDRAEEASEIFVTVSTPWAIRNYVHTGILRRLSERARVTILATPPLAECLRSEGHESYLGIKEWDSGPEPLSWRLGRQLRKKVYMETRGIQTERIWRRYSRRPLYQRLSAPLIAAAARGINGSRGLSLARSIDLRVNRSHIFREQFEAVRGRAILFATHADTYFEEAVLRSAEASGIPAALMVLSWDHLSTKVVLGPSYRRILVWTDLQRQEVLASYPWYHAEQIQVVGIPHYDLYFQPTTTSRREWCAKYGLDVSKRTLVYYSMPQVRHGSQHLIVEELAAAIEGGVELPSDLQILIKCHPFDDPAMYARLCNRYAFVRMLSTTLPTGPDPMSWLPDPGETAIARDCLAFADVTTNIYSTVTIEAALFDKPIVHIAFDAATLPPGRVPCREYYNFTHFRPIVETNASTLAYSQRDLHRLLSGALANPGDRAAERRELAARFLGPMDGRSSERVGAELEALLTAPDAGRRKTGVSTRTSVGSRKEL